MKAGSADLPKLVERISEPISALIDVSIGKTSKFSNKTSCNFVNEANPMILVVSRLTKHDKHHGRGDSTTDRSHHARSVDDEIPLVCIRKDTLKL